MKKCIVFLFLILGVLANANVRMPLLFSDGMVLQRSKSIPVWGWADANEKIEVRFNKQTKTITADATGKWMVKLDTEKAGGPYELSIIGKNKIVITNVLVVPVLCERRAIFALGYHGSDMGSGTDNWVTPALSFQVRAQVDPTPENPATTALADRPH